MQNKSKNKRALLVLAFFALTIVIFNWAYYPFMTHWQAIQGQIASQEKTAKAIKHFSNPQATLAQRKMLEIVPIFVMPTEKNEQLILFSREVDKQIAQSGLELTAPPRYINEKGTKIRGSDYHKVEMKLAGKGSFQQIIDCLVKLYENPYLCAIEEIKLACGQQQRQEMEFNLTLSTMIK